MAEVGPLDRCTAPGTTLLGSGNLRGSVAVTPGHLGMGEHPRVLELTLERPRHPVGAWQSVDATVAA